VYEVWVCFQGLCVVYVAGSRVYRTAVVLVESPCDGRTMDGRPGRHMWMTGARDAEFGKEQLQL
jgi:hypothetical protein